VLTKQPVPVAPEEPVAKGGSSSQGGATAPAASSSAGSSSSKPQPPAAAPPAAPKPADDGKLKVNPKFQSLDAYLRDRRFDTGTLPGSQIYKTARVTQNGMIKIPPAVSIKQQPFRHVDTLSVINVPEIENFIGYWQHHLLENAMQRVGWMYGYYLEDANYDEGCRAIMEGVYEPPQEMIGEMAQPKDDPQKAMVDRIAEALGLERIGWIFTSLILDDGLLVTPAEVLTMGRLQNENCTDAHFTKYRLSKFVTCAIRPDPNNGGSPCLNPFMISDQCTCMVRDGILNDNADRKHCVVREPQKNEILPDFLVESKPNKKILTDFFVVRVNDTAPKKHQRMFTHADFPRENRQTHPQKRDDIKKYFKKIPTSEPSWSRFADFHLILYIAKEIDEATAMSICECVRDRKEIPEGTRMLIDAMCQ